MSGDAQFNVIGGDRTVGVGLLGQGNLIGGNSQDGVNLEGSGTVSNTVSGNYIGVNVLGLAALPNRASLPEHSWHHGQT